MDDEVDVEQVRDYDRALYNVEILYEVISRPYGDDNDGEEKIETQFDFLIETYFQDICMNYLLNGKVWQDFQLRLCDFALAAHKKRRKISRQSQEFAIEKLENLCTMLYGYKYPAPSSSSSSD